MTLETRARQALAGHALSVDPPRCATCGAPLREGARVGVCARQTADGGEWVVVSTYCAEHTPRAARESPTVAVVLAHAKVGALVDTGRQRHDPALLAVEIVDANPPGPAPERDDVRAGMPNAPELPERVRAWWADQ